MKAHFSQNVFVAAAAVVLAGVLAAVIVAERKRVHEVPPLAPPTAPVTSSLPLAPKIPPEPRVFKGTEHSPLTLGVKRFLTAIPEELIGGTESGRKPSPNAELAIIQAWFEKDDKRIPITIDPETWQWKVDVKGLFKVGDNTFELVSAMKGDTVMVQEFTIIVVMPKVNTVSEGLTVDWLEAPVKVPLTTIIGPDKERALARREDYSSASPQGFKLGVVSGGTFDGRPLYLFSIGYCEGPGCTSVWYRVLTDSKTGTVSYLSRHSDELYTSYEGEGGWNYEGEGGWEEVSLIDELLPSVVIPALVRPDQFTLQGVTLKRYKRFFSGGFEGWFSDQELVAIATHEQYGTVYTTPAPAEPGKRYASHAFYLRLPDSRAIPYRFDIPFVKDGRIPELTWSDGVVNDADYSSADMSGCGATNEYAVRSESSLKPSERLIAGGTTKTSDTVYVLKNTADQELKDLYETFQPYRAQGEERPSVDEFLARRPLFYWKDPFNRWIRFTRTDILPAVECGKPVIYLYPERTTNVKVAVGLKGKITASEPAYGRSGWNVSARPDGYVVNHADGKEYPNLFWEGTGVQYEVPSQGFVVRYAEVEMWLKETLGTIGFTKRESQEFREFWVPRLPKTPYIFITFVPQADFDRDAPLLITPKPDVIYRIFMEYEGLQEPRKVSPLPLPSIVRQGFTVVEWGGALRKMP